MVCSLALAASAMRLRAAVLRCFSTSVRQKQALTKSYIQGRAETALLGLTLGDMLDSATERFANKEMLVFSKDNVRRTFAEFRKEADGLASGLLSLGLQSGDRVGIWSPNHYEWTLAQYATAKAGLIMVNVNPAYRLSELEYAMKKVGLKALIAAQAFKTQDYYEMLFEICPELARDAPGKLKSHRLTELSTVIMFGGPAKPGSFSLEEVMAMSSAESRACLRATAATLYFDQAINIQFTSGTTGSPKAATLTHHNILNNAYFFGRRLRFHEQPPRICVPVPLYHCFGMVLGSLQTICHGATCVFPAPSFDPEATLQAIQKEKCTALYGTPTMFIDMLNHPNFGNYDLTSLRTGIMSGAPCPIEVIKEVITRLHMPDVTIGYGSTETSPLTFQTFMTDPVEKRVSTIGVPIDHVEAKIIDQAGGIASVGTPGELCTRGYTTMLYYWNDAAKTSEVISPSRWYHTGDIGVMDPEGYCKIVGRIKDMIIRGGENIYPVEVEQFLYTHPKIEDVQVVGVPDKRLGEELCAWIRPRHQQTITAEEVKEYCKGKISHFKIPKYVLFVDSYPLTITGKIQKYKLREESIKLLGLGHVTI